MGNSVLFNLGSLLFGLIAWAIPILIISKSNIRIKRCYKYIIISFSSCVISLCLQLFEIGYRVEINDLVAIMDTIDVLKWVSVVLVVVTIILNVLALIICNKNK